MKNRNILFDADVLIDFQNSDFLVLSELRRHLGKPVSTSGGS